jgi:uncharacterized membrane protein YjfL (UPF0719 family)
MDLMSLLAGLVAFAASVAAAALLVFVTYRVNTLLTSRIDEERLLLAGNRSIAIALGSIVFGQAVLLRHAVFPTMVVVRDLFVRPVTPGAAAWVLGHCLLFFLIISALSIGSVALAGWLFSKMTRSIPEREEILKDNLAVAILFAFVVLGITLIVNEGLEDLSRSIIPYAQTGVLHLQ